MPDGGANDAVVYAAHLSGVDRVFVLGGVQALAAMAYGLLGDLPVDMLVGAGNAFVAEAKRQLFGTVAIDLLAGPSEVAVLSDETADPEIVAADLLAQAEHGPNSPAALVTTSEEHGRAVIEAIERQLGELVTEPIAGPAWRDYGSVTVAKDRETAAALMDDLAPEHLEVITAEDAWYHDRLRNYGSIFLGAWSTVAYSDKGMAGTNHVLPTAGGAKHSAGLSLPQAPHLSAHRPRDHAGARGCRAGDLGLGGDGRSQRHRHAATGHLPRGLRGSAARPRDSGKGPRRRICAARERVKTWWRPQVRPFRPSPRLPGDAERQTGGRTVGGLRDGPDVLTP